MEVNLISEKLQTLQNRKPKIFGESEYRKSAILIPLIKNDTEYEVLFEVRAAHMNRQPNDVCFPGGRLDQTDPTPMSGALREFEEEVGILKTKVKNIFPLDKLVSDTGRILYPFVGEIEEVGSYAINEAEVQEVFTVPLSFFLENKPDLYDVHLEVKPEKDFPYELIHNGREYGWRMRTMQEQFYLYEDKVIWGLTAKILSQLVTLLKIET